MTSSDRLAYHIKYSKPYMDLLKKYMSSLFEEKKVEPNSELGKATAINADRCNPISMRATEINLRN